MKPSRDPDSAKYRDDPNYTWYGGRWLTPEGIEIEREAKRKWANANPFRKARRDRLRRASKQVEIATQRALEMY